MTDRPRVWFPSLKLNVDAFENRLAKAVREASPQDMRDGATRAARYIETEAEKAGLDMDPINNATSTLCTLVRELSAEVESLRKNANRSEGTN